MTDKINPDHYKTIDGVEAIDVLRHMNYNLGCAMKYIWRCGHKDDEVQELKKAIWYLENEIDRLKCHSLSHDKIVNALNTIQKKGDLP